MGNFFSFPSSYLRQWFSINGKGPAENNTLLYHCSNNHYIHNWLYEKGYNKNKNYINRQDIDELIYVLDDCNNFDLHFPNRLINNYTLWNMDNKTYWKDIDEYKLYIKKQNTDLLNKLNSLNEDERNNIYYTIIEGEIDERMGDLGNEGDERMGDEMMENERMLDDMIR